MADMPQTRSEEAQSTETDGNAGSVGYHAEQQAPLSSRCEELTNSDGSTFYANHATRTTTWRRPEVETDEDDANMREGLPAAWQALVDSDGKTYYANHESRTTTFDRPEDITGELPAGWEMLRTPQGVAYFADHNTHTATWDDPRSA
jgi:E3 ubiquitin-protein ligase NEDD4